MYRPGAVETELVKILVVDDEPEIREMLELVLSEHGWLVDQAGSAEEAIDRCWREHFDIIVLDNLMPGRRGIDAARELVADGTAATVIIFAGDLSPKLVAECRALGIMGVEKTNWDELVLRCQLLAARSHLAEHAAAALQRPLVAATA